MNRKTTLLAYIFSGLSILILIQVLYLYTTKSMSAEMLEKKIIFTSVSGLPDLAISTEATYIRHRSLATVFSIYKDDGALREYFPSTFTYSESNIADKQYTKITNE